MTRTLLSLDDGCASLTATMSRETVLLFAPLRATKKGNNRSARARAAFVPKEKGNKRRTRARLHGIAGCDVYVFVYVDETRRKRDEARPKTFKRLRSSCLFEKNAANSIDSRGFALYRAVYFREILVLGRDSIDRAQ